MTFKSMRTHINLRLIGKSFYMILPKLMKDFMEMCDTEPLSMNYDDKTKEITIRKEKGVAGA